MRIETRLVDDPTELDEVFRFRYRVYVEEMKRTQQYADHELKTIHEPLDDGGANIVARERGVMVGVVRVNWGWQPIGNYESQYQMALAEPWHPRATTITTKLMVAASHRRSTVAIQLAIKTFDYGYRAGARFNFIDCNPPLDRFFAHLGYRQMVPDFHHPEYGLVRPLVLSLADRDHLAHVGSPFVGLLDGLGEDREAARFGRQFPFEKAGARRSRALDGRSPNETKGQLGLRAQANAGESR